MVQINGYIYIYNLIVQINGYIYIIKWFILYPRDPFHRIEKYYSPLIPAFRMNGELFLFRSFAMHKEHIYIYIYA